MLRKSNELETMVSAMKILANTNPEIVHVFLVEGPCIDALIEQSKGNTNIIFATKIKKEMLGSFLKPCDIL